MPNVIYERARSVMDRKELSDFETDKKVYELYEDCIDERRREKNGLIPAKYFLDKMGGWPVLDSPKDNKTYK